MVFAEDASEPILPQSGPETQHLVSFKEKKRIQKRLACKEERHVMEVRVALPQAKELLQQPELEKDEEDVFPRVCNENITLRYLGF